MAEKVLVGKVAHYYDKAGVAAIKLTDSLAVGDRISIERGEETFEQAVTSMQIEHKAVQSAKKGDDVGIKVDMPAHEGASVYRLV